MPSFILRRIISLVFVLLIAVTVTFCLLRMAPGSPFALGEKQASPETIAAQERKFDLDGPIWWQCVRYLGFAKGNSGERSGLLQGNLKPCLKYKDRTVAELIAQALPVSAILGASALLLSTVIGVWLGSMAALRKHTWVDSATMLGALATISVPTFVTGPALVLVFSLWLGWLPVGGWTGFSSLILPAVTLAGPFVAYIARLSRTSVLEVLNQDFVRTAHAKGLSERRVLYKHVLKVGILPVVSFLGPLAANLLTGSLVIESVFSLPGMGGFFVNSVLNRDVFLCCGSVTIYCTLLVSMNLVVDIAYKWLDPRIRLE
ncbi:MAG: ABC transporter permease [Chthoniobacteraceae bacterium]